MAIGAAGLEQQHAHGRVGGQPVCEDAARGTGADDHIIECIRSDRHACGQPGSVSR